MTRRTRFPSIHESLWVILLLGTLTSGWALAQGHGAQRNPVSRTVFVTDSRCGTEVHTDEKNEGGTRTAVLRCLARGAHLVLHERSTDRLFEIDYESPDLVIKMTNEFAGREAVVRGLWDDQKLAVVVQDVLPAQHSESSEMAPRRR